MLFAARVTEGRLIFVAVACFAALLVMIVYLPVALIRESTRSEDEVLPGWMGTVRGRRNRLRVVLALLGGLALAVAAVVMLGR
jgi:hypothetical protein